MDDRPGKTPGNLLADILQLLAAIAVGGVFVMWYPILLYFVFKGPIDWDHRSIYAVHEGQLRGFVAAIDERAKAFGFAPRDESERLPETRTDAPFRREYWRADGARLIFCSRGFSHQNVMIGVGLIDSKKKNRWRPAMDGLEAALASFERRSEYFLC